MTRYSPPSSRRLRSMLMHGTHHRSDRKRSCILPLTGVINLLAFIPVRGGAEAACSLHLS